MGNLNLHIPTLDNDNTYVAPVSCPVVYNYPEEIVKKAAALYANDPIGFAVTDDLSPMLNKIGYTKVGEIPQYFNGELVNKHVYVNHAVTAKDLNNWLVKHGLSEMKFPMLNYEYRPPIHQFPISDLIKKQSGGMINYLQDGGGSISKVKSNQLVSSKWFRQYRGSH